MTSATTQSFLECFTQTAMFRAFIDERLNGIVEGEYSWFILSCKKFKNASKYE